MAYREVSRVEIATGTGLSRSTVCRYIAAAVGVGLTRDGPAASEDQLSRLAGLNLSSPRRGCAADRGDAYPVGRQIYEWLSSDRLQLTASTSCLETGAVGSPTHWQSGKRTVLRFHPDGVLDHRPPSKWLSMDAAPHGDTASILCMRPGGAIISPRATPSGSSRRSRVHRRTLRRCRARLPTLHRRHAHRRTLRHLPRRRQPRHGPPIR